jgi:putative tryptophan/tyrosine transport system substrate-binding protein
MSRILLLFLVMAAGLAHAAEPGYAGWFKLSPEVLANWEIVPTPGDPDRVKLIETKPVSGPVRQVMVLYPRASTAYDVAMGTILNLFQEERGIDGHFTVVNFDRNDARGKAALKQAEADGIELILSMGSESTAWLYEHYRGGRLPVITLCSKDPVELKQLPDYDSGSGHNIAFTSLNMRVDAQFAYLLELRPQLRNIAVLVDSQNKSAVRTQSQPLIRLARERGIGAMEIAVADPANAAAELANLVPAAVARMRRADPELKQSIFWITGSTSVFKEIATINRAADHVPVLSAVPDVVKAEGAGAVMSIGVGFESNAHLAGLYAFDVLTGRIGIGELKVGVVSPPDIAIDFRRAREIGFKVPFGFFERASTIYDPMGRLTRQSGKRVAQTLPAGRTASLLSSAAE